MKNYFISILLLAMPLVALNNQKELVAKRKELPYAVLDGRQVIIIQNPQQDGHVHTIKRTHKTINKLEAQRRLPARLRK